MNLVRRFLKALHEARVRRHKRWLLRNRILLPSPDPKCQRNRVESAPQ